MRHSPRARACWALPGSVPCPALRARSLSPSFEAVIPSPLATIAPGGCRVFQSDHVPAMCWPVAWLPEGRWWHQAGTFTIKKEFVNNHSRILKSL